MIIAEFLAEILLGLIAGIFELLFVKIIGWALKRIGGFVRWLIFKKDFSYTEILQQDWNKRVGLISIILLVSSVLIIKYL